MKLELSILVKTVVLLCAFTLPAQAFTCKGASLWNSLPGGTKQQLMAAANKQPYATGRFYKIERGGRVSYILGTIHVPPIKQLKLPAHVMQKVQKSKLVYLEKSNKEFKAFAAMTRQNPGYYRAGGLTSFSKYFTAAQWAQVRSALVAAGWKKGAAETLHPWVILDQIEGLGCGQDNESFQLSLDARVMRVADRYKIPMIGLETPAKVDAHYRALSQSNIADMIKSLPIMDPKYPHGGMGKSIIGLLASENIVLTYVFEDYIARSNPNQRGVRLRKDFLDKKILYARNKAWMPALTRALDAGGAFVAVGAAHLGGRYGLLPMLQQKGYKISRIPLG